MRAFDCAATPLGPIAAWPAQLRTLVDVLLRAPVGMALIWGENELPLAPACITAPCAVR